MCLSTRSLFCSMADLPRPIPSMVDGLKPGQRKILFCSLKRNFVKEAKVAQFSGYISEHSAYHHGEESLASTIIGMPQNYVRSNNINLLQPNGQFSTRNQEFDLKLRIDNSASKCNHLRSKSFALEHLKSFSQSKSLNSARSIVLVLNPSRFMTIREEFRHSVV